MTSPSPLHTPSAATVNNSADLDVIERAERARAVDRRAFAVVRGLVKWTLIASLLLVPIVAIALPSCTMRSPCRSKQSEAKGNLKALYVAEESYRAEFDRYIVDQRALEWAPKGVRLRYEYFVKTDVVVERGVDVPHFEAWAVGVGDEVVGDVWRIDDQNMITNELNGCSR